MARFERKVERQKSEFTFSKKPFVKVSKYKEFKENFNFKWIPTNWKAILLLVFDFLIPSLIVIPLLMQHIDQYIAFIIGHGVFTSLLIVGSFYLYNKKKPTIWGLLGRYCFSCLTISAVSFVILLLV